MSILASNNLPSLLVFGSQTEFPSEQALQSYRQELLGSSQLSALKGAVDDLPQFWQRLNDFDSSLRSVPGKEYLQKLKDWVNDGGSFPYRQSDAPNHYALAVTVLIQIIQYTRYLHQLGSESHSKILDSVKTGGIHGHCVGLLTAIAVATSNTEAELGPSAAVALRLAVLIGAYVDQDGSYSKQAQEYTAVAIRWQKEDDAARAVVTSIVNSISGAYISSNNDVTSVTATVKNADIGTLTEKARSHNLRTKVLHVHGRFHTADHSRVVDKLLKEATRTLELNFPATSKLRTTIRNAEGQIFTGASLTQLALESTLLKASNWYATVKSSLQQLPKSKQFIAVGGSGDCVPGSLAQSESVSILTLASLASTEPKLVTEQVNGNLGDGLNVHGVYSGEDLSHYPSHSIAIVGMAGRFPGADTVDELWELISNGKVMVQPAPVERLGLSQTGEYADKKWWGNFLKDSETFDHKFFGKSSREALAWDPQQRILLEVIYEALESSGYFGASGTAETLDYGCYVGACMNNYYDNVSCYPSTAYGTVGTSRCFFSGSMSHYFGWTGPSLTIDTACSSSLVAINTACRAIWSGECARAVAGGTNVICSPFDYFNLSAAGFLSPSGQCKPFDAGADGYCRGEGVSVVVLKPLADAIADSDNIHGVIVGSGANQNHNYAQITAPNSDSQVELFRKVVKLSGIDAESVSYVEAHGTGTGVGDPIEVRSIRDTFAGPERESRLHFGSIKGNIGHTEATAGVAGLIKTLLMMKHRQITAQASHQSLNPKITAFDHEKMAIARDVMPWKAPVLLAAVNSYGAAGSNSAVIVREKPALVTPPAPVELAKYPLFISAGSRDGIARYSKKLLDWLRETQDQSCKTLASVVFNLADRGNHLLPHQLATSVTSIQDLQTKLEAAATGSDVTKPSAQRKPVVLVFGGQESESIGLSESVYNSSKIFKKHLDDVNNLLMSTGKASFFPSIFDAKPMADLVTLHSALFAVQYASAKSWMDCGVKVEAVVGHSFGQLTALCISGALSLSDAFKLVSGRAALMQKYWGAESGSMLFLQADRVRVEEYLRLLTTEDKSLYAEIACLNGPESHVVVGSAKAIEVLQQLVAKSQNPARTKKLEVTNGFHSKFTEPMLEHLTSLALQLDWRAPEIHLETTDEMSSNTEPDYKIVAEHTRKSVFFHRAVERLCEKFSDCTWIEAGRGSSVISLAKGSVSGSKGHTFYSPQLSSSTNAQDSLTSTTVELWKEGYAIQFWPFHRSQKLSYELFNLPPIQFERTSHWLGYKPRDAEQDNTKAEAPQIEDETHELLTFHSFQDKAKTEAVFNIDPHSDRFKSMLGGHVMAGQPLCPASLYFEVAARAALYLENDLSGSKYVPTVDDLLMNSPIGHSTTKRISLILKKTEGAYPSWSFSITTQELEGSAQPFEHSTGKVYLKTRDDAQAAREFERFESLTGYRRHVEVMNHPDAEKMQGRHVYRAFNTVVYYAENFHGIKSVANVGLEGAGIVRLTPNEEDPVDQRLCDTPMTDSFMQFAGFLVNYFNNPNPDEVLVCMNIEHIEMGGDFDPNAGEWVVYSTMTEGGKTDASSDAYVFDARTKKMVFAAFGLRFSKMSQNTLLRILKSVNKSAATSKALEKEEQISEPVAVGTHDAPAKAAAPRKQSSGKRQQILQLLSDVTDVPVSELGDSTTLDDIGIDSLMATEVLNDVRSAFGVTIDLSSFLFFPSIRTLIDHVNEKLGLSEGDEDDVSDGSTASRGPSSDVSSDDGYSQDSGVTTPNSEMVIDESKPTHKEATMTSAIDAFEETRFNYDDLARATQAAGFWKEAYPGQARMVLAYVVEAFSQIGCVLQKLKKGDVVPQVKALQKHTQLVRQLYRILEDGKLIESSKNPNEFIRTAVVIDTTPAEAIYHEIIDQHPQHATVNKLIRASGTDLAPILRGDKEGIQVLFGNRECKKTLEEMYEFWPVLRTPTLVLGDYLAKAFASKPAGSGKFRILELGAGTGGTTRYLVNHLRSQGIDFEYVFTDLGASLVNAASRQFKGQSEMLFDVLDVEKPPKKEYEGAFHCVLASNCVHATSNLDVCLKNIRKMLRDDGVLTLIELTQNIFGFDIIFGPLEGWWLFNDGREHALSSERHWERRMRAAGFEGVSWSEGKEPESKTARVIAAFPTAGEVAKKKPVKAAIETVVYKQVGSLDVHADIYYPLEGEVEAGTKMPIALMIHGGSQMLFSRKDVRPAQTRLLLEKGFLPISIDYRLCPEVPLASGPMEDVCDAFEWARNGLPGVKLPRSKLNFDGENVVVVGWSSGGQLAMSLAWTAPLRGLAPPQANLVFYAPTDYEDDWWQHPIHPNGSPYTGQEYDVLEGVQEEPITTYDMIGAWEEPVADPRSIKDPRCRIVLHINWKAQTLPIIINGLPSKKRAAIDHPDVKDWHALPQPSIDAIRAVSPRAHIQKGDYNVPTFFIHGTSDDLIPWEQSEGTYKAMVSKGIKTDLVLLNGAPHICDLSGNPKSDGWKAVLKAYDFITSHVSKA